MPGRFLEGIARRNRESSLKRAPVPDFAMRNEASISKINVKWRAFLWAALASLVVAIPVVGALEVWRQDRSYVEHLYRLIISLAILWLIAIATFLIGYFNQRALTADADNSHTRLNMAMMAGKSMGWDLDVRSGRVLWFGDLKTLFGIGGETIIGDAEHFFRFVHPEDRERVNAAVADARDNHKSYETECRIIRPDKTFRWITAKGEFFYSKTGEPVRMLGTGIDTTERKRTQQILQESEERFRLVANSVPVMIWMEGTNRERTYFNQPWLAFTGRTPEQELSDGWIANVHPDDRKARLDTYTQDFDQKKPFEMQYRLRRRDGQYRWILENAVPRFEPGGAFAGYIGSCIDITERKLAEEAIAHMGRRLIEAHEEERTWIGRELHDDINQRIALLAVGMERLKQDLPNTLPHFQAQIQQLRTSLFDLSKDVQALSHRLHSSKLEYLGIAAAARSFCAELAEQQHVEIAFHHSDLPQSLSREISLCLFRVLQEALQNAVKHSRAHEFRVELYGTSTELTLEVVDAGVGFDQEQAMRHHGLGLTSMRERLKLVGGVLVIESERGHGTKVRARVPLNSEIARMDMAC